MKTQIAAHNAQSIQQAAQLLRQSQVVGMPTETVYGLAASAYDPVAVQRIFEAKGRPQDNPLIVHISSMDMLEDVVSVVPDTAMRLAEAFWPGPLTMVLPKAEKIPTAVSAGLDTVGVRMPAHPTAREMIAAAGVPLAAPSANLSGSPSPTSAQHVYHDMDGKIPLILDGGSCPVGVESTVLSLVGAPMVLRPGFVTRQEIADVLGCEVALAPSLEAPLEDNVVPASPGMKYKHYAPAAKLTILNGSKEQFVAYVKNVLAQEKPTDAYVLCFEGEEADMPVSCVTYGQANDAASQARALFDALRMLDTLGAKKAYVRSPIADGVGQAVRNRLLRAAAFNEVQL